MVFSFLSTPLCFFSLFFFICFYFPWFFCAYSICCWDTAIFPLWENKDKGSDLSIRCPPFSLTVDRQSCDCYEFWSLHYRDSLCLVNPTCTLQYVAQYSFCLFFWYAWEGIYVVLSLNRTYRRHCFFTQFLLFKASSAPFPCPEAITCRTHSGEINNCQKHIEEVFKANK